MARSITDVTQRHCGLVPDGQTGISLNPNLAVGRDRFNICQVLDGQGRDLTNANANMQEILSNWVNSTPARVTSLPLQRDHVILLDNVGRQQVKGIDTRLSHTFELSAGKLGLIWIGHTIYRLNVIKPAQMKSNRW
ncbi:TonB-dependent receptor [Alishewanella longhuensis]